MNITVFDTPQQMAESVAYKLMSEVKKKVEVVENFYLAVSGGSTPKVLFETLAKPPFNTEVLWQFLHVFWVDERCVPPGDSDSNYGMTKNSLLDKVNIPSENIHRIKGEDDPIIEIKRYAAEIKSIVPSKTGLPCFDWILLGIGTDGHTASLFPGVELEAASDSICGSAVHPVSGQHRITLTKEVINNGAFVSFLVSGKDKAAVVNEIRKGLPAAEKYPAAHINPERGTLEWLIDKEAADKF